MINKFLFLRVLTLILITSCSNKSLTIINPNSKKDSSTKAVSEIQISPILVGNNVWYKNPTPQVWELTAQSGVTSIRIGGHAYDVEMPSKAELLDWVKRIQATGAEPIMQVSQYDLATSAADLVKYFNVDLASGKAIKYWNIGNEPWLQNGKPELSTVGAMVEAYFKPRSKAMKAVDPTIKIYGPDECYYMEEAMNDLFGGKNDISGKIPGKDYYYCDGISWHRYPQETNINLAYEGIEDFKKSIIKCKAKVDFVNAMHNRSGDDALGWGIGEYNAKAGPQVHTWENGQMFGGVLNLCMKYGATFATTWSMFENDGNRKGTDFSSIDGAKMTPRPSYRHMQMIAKNFKGIYVEGKSSLPDIITFGAVNGTTISVMIMNRANTPATFTLHLNKTAATVNGNVQLNIDASSTIVYTGAIEALATHTYVFKNNEINRTVYTNQHFINEKAPDESKL
ncbi:hypothetical protein [Flavobacterium nackdongense]|uniref:Asl1-like glycosyl hydrolase catalytic domain-containing protein n=1 Tax=Flavobacterium nackdongense TaxID=2547394 RepID=A0A4P6YIR7_9FLAO|nr:hypothetical protein [Flavobacterium nackdongense]QBN20393.1 hypothetical protein E1750_16880 [Flavobacterium nackdongense]